MTDYPNFPAWVALLNERDQGFLLCMVLGVIGAAWAINVWVYFPARRALFRRAVWVAFLGVAVFWFLLSLQSG
ncbi:MAG: hypothetical protein HKUEN02_01030 [Anaerolineaceae bacterium]|nr:MAG: hypothetical protein HKUEN02_01030 [Anaerolineaceae bacterium]